MARRSASKGAVAREEVVSKLNDQRTLEVDPFDDPSHAAEPHVATAAYF